MKILIIDDDAGYLEQVEKILSREFEVLKAVNGSKGLEIVSNERVDLVLLDLYLPDMSGIEVLKKIRSIEPFLPVLIITEYPDYETAVEAMKFCAVDYIKKDFEIEFFKDHN